MSQLAVEYFFRMTLIVHAPAPSSRFSVLWQVQQPLCQNDATPMLLLCSWTADYRTIAESNQATRILGLLCTLGTYSRLRTWSQRSGLSCGRVSSEVSLWFCWVHPLWSLARQGKGSMRFVQIVWALLLWECTCRWLTLRLLGLLWMSFQKAFSPLAQLVDALLQFPHAQAQQECFVRTLESP